VDSDACRGTSFSGFLDQTSFQAPKPVEVHAWSSAPVEVTNARLLLLFSTEMVSGSKNSNPAGVVAECGSVDCRSILGGT